MILPIFQTAQKELSLLQTSWSTALNPILSNQILSGLFLTDVVLSVGVNTINHLLSRKMVGWFLTDQNGAVQVYRSAPLNAKTLTLTSDAAVTVSIYVF